MINCVPWQIAHSAERLEVELGFPQAFPSNSVVEAAVLALSVPSISALLFVFRLVQITIDMLPVGHQCKASASASEPTTSF